MRRQAENGWADVRIHSQTCTFILSTGNITWEVLNGALLSIQSKIIYCKLTLNTKKICLRDLLV